MTNAVAVVLFVAITAYAVFGGADFGAGFWDLIAGGAERGERPRALIDHSIGPVWEANHVWLIFSLVVLWTAFSEAFASITLTLFVPLTLAALGIVLRGSSFAFRKAVFRTRDRRNFGAAFAVSSVLVPYCMGAVAGAIASGRVPAGGEGRRPVVELDQPDVDPRRRARGLRLRVPRGHLPGVGRPPARATRPWSSTSGAGPSAPRSPPASSPSSGIFVLHADATYVFHGLTLAGAAPRHRLGRVRHRARSSCWPGDAAAGPGCWPSARWRRSWWRGAWRSGPTCCRRR